MDARSGGPALSGLKILDLSMNLPGPYLTWLLACLGAEVVKVENPDGGDYARSIGGEDGLGPRYFAAVNRNKKSLALNLKHPRGRAALLRLLASHDVLVEGFRPGAMERLGLGFAELSARQPRLIQVSITGYGHQGPNRLRAGHDINYLALAGVLGMTGTRAGELALPGVQMADLFGGSLLALAGLLAAVIQRGRTGRGQFVDAAMFDGSLSLATMIQAGVAAGLEEPRPGGMTLNGRYPCYGLYRCLGGGWMSLGALEPKFWANFCEAAERPDLIPAQFGGPETIAELKRIFAGRSREDWTRILAGHDCCCEPVLDLKEAAASELARARGMLDQAGGSPGLLACPLKLSGSPNPASTPAPVLGRHSREVLLAGGLSAAEVDELTDLGVLGT